MVVIEISQKLSGSTVRVKTVAVQFSKISSRNCQIAWRHIPEDTATRISNAIYTPPTKKNLICIS
jgi:hypothetical protein